MKLSTTISISNMVCFDENGSIKKYNTPGEILKDFYRVRLEYYVRRKDNLVKFLGDELERLDNKVRFIREVVDGTLVVSRRKKAEICQELEAKSYKRIGNDYEYLLSMSISSLTTEKIERLITERDEKEKELKSLLGMSPKMIWREDLEMFIKTYEKNIENEKENDFTHKGKKRKIAGRNSLNTESDAIGKKRDTKNLKKDGKVETKGNGKGKGNNLAGSRSSKRPWERYNIVLSSSE